MIEKLGLIGTGYMGRPIAKNLLQAKFPLTIFVRREHVREDMRALGADIAASPAELARNCNIIFLLVTGSDAVRELLFSRNGIVEGAAKGTIIVDMTTSEPRYSKNFAKRLLRKGIEYLDAPISGGVLGAQNAQLLVMVGGEKEIYERCLPVFEPISKRVIYLGEVGSGHLVKLIHNQLSFSTFLAACEAVILGEKLGLPTDAMMEVFNSGNARSYATEVRFPKFILTKTFNMGGTFNTVYKDMSIARKLGKAAKVNLPISNCVYRYFKNVVDRGEGEEDYSKIILKMKDLLIR